MNFAEITFRLRQEAHNLRGYFLPPRLPSRALRCAMASVLPDGQTAVEKLSETPYAADVVRLADGILKHNVSLFDEEVSLGSPIRWNCDYRNNLEWTGSELLRRVPYLDSARVGDHKWIWELNRHQHLVVLAQARLLTGQRTYSAEIENQLMDWIESNRYARGMQWVSALEVAFRVLSWLWVWRLVGEDLSERCRSQLLTSIWRHGVYLERNLSIYFSPNTHLLGEAVALHAIGRLFPGLPLADRWRARGRQIVAEQMDVQIRSDGSHFEQSSYYHVYACDFFLLHAILEEPSRAYRERLRRAGRYLWDLLGPTGRLPFFGDDDGGRLFHPYGRRDCFGRATLAAMSLYFEGDEESLPCSPRDLAEIGAWWFGETACVDGREEWRPYSRNSNYPDARVATIWQGDRQLILDAGAFGAFSAGHSHAHALSIVLRAGGRELLIDPGTYTYTGDAQRRSIFRGTPMHSTVTIQGAEQARDSGPFGWATPRPGEIVEIWEQGLKAVFRYADLTHIRRVEFQTDRLVVVDLIDGSAVSVTVDQVWRPGVEVARSTANRFDLAGVAELAFAAAAEVTAERGGQHGWRSLVYGTKIESDVIRQRYVGPLPVTLSAEIIFKQPQVD